MTIEWNCRTLLQIDERDQYIVSWMYP